jgi:hypothetical protein
MTSPDADRPPTPTPPPRSGSSLVDVVFRPTFWISVLIAATAGLGVAVYLGAYRGTAKHNEGGAASAEIAPPGPVLTARAQSAAGEVEVQSTDTVAADATLSLALKTADDGYVLLAHVDPTGTLRTLYPPHGVGHAAPPSKAHVTEPLAMAKQPPGVHRLYLVEGKADFDVSQWRTAEGRIRVVPPELRVTPFVFERAETIRQNGD